MRTSLPLKITIIMMKDLDESSNAYQAHNDPVDHRSDEAEEAPGYDDDEENDTFSSYVALDDVTVFVTFAEDYGHTVNPESEVGEEVLDCEDGKKYDTLSSKNTLDDASIFEAAELDAIALLADTWDNDLDPEVSAQLVQANVRACISFGKEKGKSRRAKVRASFLFAHHVCHSAIVVNN